MNLERDRIHQIWGGVALIAVVLGAFVYLLSRGIDSSPLVAVIASVVTPIVTAIYLVNQMQGVRRDSMDIKSDTREIKQQVNGHMATLTAKIPDATPTTNGDGASE